MFLIISGDPSVPNGDACHPPGAAEPLGEVRNRTSPSSPGSGGVEVVFEHLSRREPFTQPELPIGLLDRINAVPGVQPNIDAGDIGRRRPGFPIDVLTGASLDRFREALTWFSEEALRVRD
ncbi:hypothetical protein [Kitasatospora sp. NPDC088346]|uniref:hypothetical protein n=1 Tax=Kitasatospora sp. NPDC088346 TaxID=3364073 RepID=UPI0037FDBEA4